MGFYLDLFPIMAIFTAIMMIFLKKAYKYSDSRFLFFAFVSLNIGGFFALVSGDVLFGSFKFFEHAIGAGVTGWLLAFDTFHLAQK